MKTNESEECRSGIGESPMTRKQLLGLGWKVPAVMALSLPMNVAAQTVVEEPTVEEAPVETPEEAPPSNGSPDDLIPDGPPEGPPGPPGPPGGPLG